MIQEKDSIRNMLVSIVLVSCLFAVAQDAGAAEKKRPLQLDVRSAIDLALEESEELKLQGNAVSRNESIQREENAQRLPQVSGEIGWSNNFEYPAIPATAMMQEYQVAAGVTVSQALFTFGRIANALSAAKKAVEASRFTAESTKQEVIYNAKVAYYNAYLAKRTLEIAEASYQNVLNNKKILEDRSSGGRVSRYDNIKISADSASRKPTVNNARAHFVSALEIVKRVIGVGADEAIELVETFAEDYPDVDREALVGALHDNQPALKALAKNIEATRALVGEKRAALLPEISAFATWDHEGGSSKSHIHSDDLEEYGIAGVKVSVPIWAGGENREKLNQAKIAQNDAELRYTQGEKDYLLLLDRSVNEYREYKDTLESNREAVQLAEESFTYSQELFGSGQISVTDLNDAELQLTNARLNTERTLYNLHNTLALIERITVTGTGDE